MKLSLILPTHRSSYAAISRIIEWSSFDSPDIELIVSDNSESEIKQTFLSMLDSQSLKLHFTSECGPFENAFSAYRQATGDFILFLADDDWLSMRGVRQLHALAEKINSDPSVTCITGDYLVEGSFGSGIFRYPSLDGTDPVERVSAYLKSNAPNYLYYSAVRRSLADICFGFAERLPYRFSYHDQLISLLYLTSGRTLQINRVIYGYDIGEWETHEKTLAKDRSMYLAAGLPVEYDLLHHLFCALEGALLLDSDMVREITQNENAAAADLWFQTMFAKFTNDDRSGNCSGGRSISNAAVLKLRQNLLTDRYVDLSELLLDVCDVLGVSDQDGAQRYFNFWSAL